MNRYYRPKHLFFAFFCIFTVLACNTDSQKKDSLHTIPPKIDTVKKQSIRLMGNENVTKKSKKIHPPIPLNWCLSKRLFNKLG
jgi:hypothetical protein